MRLRNYSDGSAIRRRNTRPLGNHGVAKENDIGEKKMSFAVGEFKALRLRCNHCQTHYSPWIRVRQSARHVVLVVDG